MAKCRKESVDRIEVVGEAMAVVGKTKVERTIRKDGQELFKECGPANGLKGKLNW